MQPSMTRGSACATPACTRTSCRPTPMKYRSTCDRGVYTLFSSLVGERSIVQARRIITLVNHFPTRDLIAYGQVSVLTIPFKSIKTSRLSICVDAGRDIFSTIIVINNNNDINKKRNLNYNRQHTKTSQTSNLLLYRNSVLYYSRWCNNTV